MINVQIYYLVSSDEQIGQAVSRIETFISSELNNKFQVRGVIIDQDHDRDNFDSLVESLRNVDMLILNKRIEDDFDMRMLTELSRAEEFELCLMSDSFK